DADDGEGADAIVHELRGRLRMRGRLAIRRDELLELRDAHEEREAEDADAVPAADLPRRGARRGHPDGGMRLLERTGDDAARRNGDEAAPILEGVLRPPCAG